MNKNILIFLFIISILAITSGVVYWVTSYDKGIALEQTKPQKTSVPQDLVPTPLPEQELDQENVSQTKPADETTKEQIIEQNAPAQEESASLFNVHNVKTVNVASGYEKPSIAHSNNKLLIAYRDLEVVVAKLFDDNLQELILFTPIQIDENFEIGSKDVAALGDNFLFTYSERNLANRKDEKLKAILANEKGQIINQFEVDQGIGDAYQHHHLEGGASGANIAFSAARGFIVWHDTRNGPFQAFGRWLDAAGNFLGGDFRIDQGTITNPSVIWPNREDTGQEQAEVTAQKTAVNPFGEAIAVWADERDPSNTAAKSNFFRIFTPDGFITSERQIKLGPNAGADHAAVEFFNGNWIIVWKEDSSPLFGMDIEGEETSAEQLDKDKMENSAIKLFLNVYDRKANLLKERVRVDSSGKVYVGRGMGFVEKTPSIKTGEDNFLIVWTDYRNGKPQVFARAFNKDFIPGKETFIANGWKSELTKGKEHYFLSYQEGFNKIFLTKLLIQQ